MKIDVNNKNIDTIKWKNIYQGIEEDLKYKLNYADENTHTISISIFQKIHILLKHMKMMTINGSIF